MTMQRIENISLFLKALEVTWRISALLLFRPVDLHDSQNLKKVALTLIEYMKVNGEVRVFLGMTGFI